MDFPQPYSSPDRTWASVAISSVDLAVYAANATSSYQYWNLTITSNSGSVGKSGNYNGVYSVNGVIQNTGSQTAANLTVVTTFCNITGTVVAVGNTYENLGGFLTSTLAPSGTISFQVPAFDLTQSLVPSSEKISSYSLLVQAQGPILQGTAPTVIPYPSPESSQSPGVTNSPSLTQPKAANSNNSSIQRQFT